MEDAELKRSFAELQRVISETLMLRHLNPEKPTRVKTDASDFAVEVILSQHSKIAEMLSQHLIA